MKRYITSLLFSTIFLFCGCGNPSATIEGRVDSLVTSPRISSDMNASRIVTTIFFEDERVVIFDGVPNQSVPRGVAIRIYYHETPISLNCRACQRIDSLEVIP